MQRQKVAVLFTRPESIFEDIDTIMELAGAKAALDPQADTVIKDITSWHRPFPSVNTTPWQLEGVITSLKKAGFSRLSVLFHEGLATDVQKAEETLGYLPILKAHLVPSLNSSRPSHVSWETYTPRQDMLILHKIFPKGIPIPDYLINKNLVYLPTLKCDPAFTLSGTIPAGLPTFLPQSRYKIGQSLHKVLVDLLAIQRETQAGLFTVMDGTMAGHGQGPRLVTPVQKNVIMASSDPVAADAIALKMMGFDPMKVDYIRLAHERGLGIGHPGDIDVVGHDVSGESWNFQALQSKIGRLASLGLLGRSKALVSRPFMLRRAKQASHLYHDVYQWKRGEAKKVFQAWRRESPWGKLFEEYLARGNLLEPGSF